MAGRVAGLVVGWGELPGRKRDTRLGPEAGRPRAPLIRPSATFSPRCAGRRAIELTAREAGEWLSSFTSREAGEGLSNCTAGDAGKWTAELHSLRSGEREKQAVDLLCVYPTRREHNAFLLPASRGEGARRADEGRSGPSCIRPGSGRRKSGIQRDPLNPWRGVAPRLRMRDPSPPAF